MYKGEGNRKLPSPFLFTKFPEKEEVICWMVSQVCRSHKKNQELFLLQIQRIRNPEIIPRLLHMHVSHVNGKYYKMKGRNGPGTSCASLGRPIILFHLRHSRLY